MERYKSIEDVMKEVVSEMEGKGFEVYKEYNSNFDSMELEFYKDDTLSVTAFYNEDDDDVFIYYRNLEDILHYPQCHEVVAFLEQAASS